EIELTPQKSQNAFKIASANAQPFAQLELRGLGQHLPRLGQPAGHGGAVNPIEPTHLVEAQPVNDLLAQQIALAWRKRAQGRGKRSGELAAIMLLEIFILRVLRLDLALEEGLPPISFLCLALSR